MLDCDLERQNAALNSAIALVEAALHECDEHAFLYAAIDLSSALDKLKLIKAQFDSK